MYARVSLVRFRDDAIDDALHIFRDIMLPAASKQPGFHDAWIFRSTKQAGQHIIISLWQTEADLLASRPPEDVVPQLQPLDEYVVEANQEIYELLFNLNYSEQQ